MMLYIANKLMTTVIMSHPTAMVSIDPDNISVVETSTILAAIAPAIRIVVSLGSVSVSIIFIFNLPINIYLLINIL